VNRTLQQCLLIGVLACAWLLCLGSGATARADEVTEQAPSGQVTSVLSRMTILVRDVDVSKRFYTHALGYEVVMDRVIDRPSVHTLMGLEPDQTVRFAILSSSHLINGKKREGAGIGLIQVGNPAPPAMTRPGGAPLASGESMMAMRTSDIGTVYRRLLELEADIIIHPMKSPDGKETELVVHDPDGVRIHVVQRPDRESGP
jgi:catechol 2,3-dioxygenase-like lactoylglutathione lyase family enzyme